MRRLQQNPKKTRRKKTAKRKQKILAQKMKSELKRTLQPPTKLIPRLPSLKLE